MKNKYEIYLFQNRDNWEVWLDYNEYEGVRLKTLDSKKKAESFKQQLENLLNSGKWD